jgi:parallel beta-helix repeat protein
MEYVVAQNQAGASDANPGTAQRPWKTISRGDDIVRPGDTIIIHTGVYREYIRPQRNGQAGAPITYMAAPGEKVTITGADFITGWKKEPGDEPIYRVPWNAEFMIDHDKAGNPIEHHPDDAPLWGRAEQVIADGKQFRPELTLQDLRDAWHAQDRSLKSGEKLSPILQSPLPNLGPTFGGAFAVDTSQKVLWIWLADGANPAAHMVLAATRGQCFGANQWQLPAGMHFIDIRGITFQYAASFPQRPAVDLSGGNNLIEDCTIEEMAGTGVAVGGTLRRCIIRNCGHTGGSADGGGFLNEDCLWEGNAWKPLDRTWDSAGVKIADVEGGVFRHCLFRRNGGNGLWFDIDVRNVTITNCIFSENELSGLFVETSREFTIVNNLALRNGIGVIGKPDDIPWGVGGIQLGESIGCTISHNTCIANKDGISLREQGPRMQHTEDSGDIAYHLANDVIVKNILADNQNSQLAFWYDNAFFGMHPSQKDEYKTEDQFDRFMRDHKPDEIFDPMKQGMVIDGNLYWARGPESVVLYGAPWRSRHRDFKTLDDFSRATQWDLHGKLADPMIALTPRGDRFYGDGSPAKALDAGWLSCPVDIDKWLGLEGAGLGKSFDSPR